MRQQDSFWVWAGAAGALLVAGAVGVYYFYQRAPQPASDVPAVVEAPRTAAPVEPPPVAVTTLPPEPEIPLPPLDESDADVGGGFTEIFGREAVEQYLVPERIVRNIVVTIDNLPREKMALQQRPIRPTPGEFLTGGPEDAIVLAPENYERYAPFVQVLSSADAKTLVSMYRGLQPLFQQAYEELGHPNNLFNARLLEVIDHLLATPEPQGPVRLLQPGVFYKYADEELERLSAGQRLLIRMGPANAAAVKAKLREIQAELV
jgi:hypothetical protein